MRKIIEINDCRECKQCIPDFMHIKCKIKNIQLDSIAGADKNAIYPIPKWCPLEDA